MLESVPMWGQVSLFGLSLGLNITFIILIARGILATRAQLEQVQKVADTFQKAWETAMTTNGESIAVLNKLTVSSDTMLKILEERPTFAQVQRAGYLYRDEHGGHDELRRDQR